MNVPVPSSATRTKDQTGARELGPRSEKGSAHVGGRSAPLKWAGGLVLPILVVLAYIPAFHAGYIWDDSDHVIQTPIQTTWSALKWIWIRPGATPQYYPLTHTTFWLEYHLWGGNPLGYHVVNILLHSLSALVLWQILRRLNLRGAWIAAAIFAIHPVHVESVAWITERKNTLSGFFYLLAMTFALRAWAIGERNPAAEGGPFDARRFPWRPYLLCALFFIAAVLSKTVTTTFPAVLVLILWWKRGRVTRKDWLMLGPFFVIALVMAKVTSGMEQWNVGAMGADFDLSFAQRVLIAGRAIWFYAGKLVWPAHLAFIYPRWNVDPKSISQWLYPLAAGSVIVLLWAMRKRIGRGPLAAALIFVGTLFPALGFIDVYPMRFSFVADHFQYLASIALIVLFAEWFWTLRVSFQLRGCIVAGVPVVLSVATARQAMAYRDEPTLWRDTLAKNPACWLAMDNLGVDAASHGDGAAALNWYDRSLAVHPNQSEGHLLRAQSLAVMGKIAEAQDEDARAIDVNPKDVRAVVRATYHLAQMAARRGDFDRAAANYQRVLELEPRLESARLEYALLLRARHQPRQAFAQYQSALEINPDSIAARSSLAEMLFQQGDLPDAMKIMAEAIEIDPSPKLCSNYGVMLIQAGQPAAAATQFSNAIAGNPQFAEAYDGLGYAYEAQGRLADAEQMYRKALELKPDFATARDHLAHIQSLGRGR